MEPQAVVANLPFVFAKKHGIFLQFDARQEAENSVVVCHKEPIAFALYAELRRYLSGQFITKKLTKEQFESQLSEAYERDSAEAMQMVESLGDQIDLATIADSVPEIEDLLEQEGDAPIIRLINAVLGEAVKENASDIHIESYEKRLVIRFRVDGVLREVVQPKRELAPLLVSRLKVMAKLDIAEKRVPQDGRISLKIGGREIDIRVSTMPSNSGERVVLRLLDKQAGRLNLKSLGMPKFIHQAVQSLLRKPHGIVLITGPTGSGKTTTLYAGLTEINDSSRNILTVEDPIEYNLEGIGQTQVNTKAEMSFARGLRAMLRQDPDVVMVGEIRDLETAEIAVQASLTGHLVLSTLHTNTAVGAMTRLRDMGIEPFLLASSLVGVISQRLVRVLCSECKQAHKPNALEKAFLGDCYTTDSVIYRAEGCDACNHLGYRGRQGIYELLTVDDTVRQLIHEKANESAIISVVRQHTSSIRSDGRQRVLAGVTTIEEVIRVTQEE